MVVGSGEGFIQLHIKSFSVLFVIKTGPGPNLLELSIRTELHS